VVDAVLPQIALPQQAWRVLLQYLRPHLFAFVAGGLVTGATGLALPLVARQLNGALSQQPA
jgi:ATP-binding cassette subfamily C protein